MRNCILACLTLFLPALMGLSLLSGCDNSGYAVAPPYVITGTVSNGGAVEGTVHVLTNKRMDRYQGAIDSETGTYSVSVTLPDPPYFVWANINGARTLYSYTTGRRNSAKDGVKDQTVNINPITDMILSLTYLEDTAEKFGDEHNGSLPKLTDLETFQDEIEALLGEVYRKTCYAGGFDLFHDPWVTGSDLETLLKRLTVTYVHDLDERSVYLYSSDPAPLFSYDLEEDDYLEKTVEAMTAADIIIGDTVLPACVDAE
jgi:hypothetical protein